MQKALIFDIKHNSLEDGPGIRSVVFFKGCPLNCAWCQNPEGKKHTLELWWESKTCIGDGACIEVCPQNAISFDFPNFINRELCNNCFCCVDVCPANALKITANNMSVDEVIEKIIPYKNYFTTSGGGVTLSGGEATLHMKFVSNLLQELKKLEIHTLIETAGHFDFEEFEEFEELIIPFVDEIYYDIKIINSKMHKHWCGVDNKLILNNFKKLHILSLSKKFKLMPRTALIPNITDTQSNIHDIALFYNSISVTKTTLLPNNPIWIEKLNNLGIEEKHFDKIKMKSLYPTEQMIFVKSQFIKYGIDARFG
ncbi:MAG: glycyl-radical enzyme activating protein [Bacteroidota bacterium]